MKLWRPKSIVTLALLLFWASYVAIGVVQYTVYMDQLIADDNARRFKRIDFEKGLAAPLLATGEIETLIENLEDLSKTNAFDFYLLKDRGEVISFFNPGHSKEETAKWNFPKDRWQFDEGRIAWRAITVRDYELILGIQGHGSEFVKAVNNQILGQLLLDLIVTSVLFVLMILFVLRDILDVTKIMRQVDRLKGKDRAPLSREGELLLAVTREYEQFSRNLKVDQERLADSLSPAIRYELALGTETPNVFSAVVCRIDVNGYTQMFLDKKDEFVTSTLNVYFQQAADIVQRYGGYIYQYVGDEIVFHFKKSEHDDVVRSAVGCIRALFEVAEVVHLSLVESGVPFHVKAAVSTGTLRFISLDSGYAFAGMPLIESVRMLGKVDEREANTLILNADLADDLSDMVQPFKRMTVNFKGFSDVNEVVEVKSFLDHPVEQFEPRVWSLKKSNVDIALVLNYLAKNINSIEREQFIAIFHWLKSLRLQKSNRKILSAYQGLLSAAHGLAISEENSLRLSSVISLAPILVKASAFNETIQKILEDHLDDPNPRTRANTILALADLKPESYSFRSVFNSEQNRPAADALFAEGRRDYTSEIHGHLLRFLKSNNPYFIASGLYVMSQLYNYHQQRDPIYFTANSDLQAIPALVRLHVNASDPMVRNRAAISASSLNLNQAA